jgi:nitrate reductase gamma subunit
VILLVLLVQIGSGIAIAIFDRWGGLWYLHTAVPWFWSLAMFRPELRTVVSLPAFVKLHFIVGFLLILLFPFSRLVHLVMLPLQYLWRPYQVVIWNRQKEKTDSYAKEVAK